MTKSVGIDAYVNPGAVTISRVLQHVRRGRIRAVHSVQRGGAEIIEAEALETSPLVGVTLRDLDLPDGMRIGAIYRDGSVIKPSGSVADPGEGPGRDLCAGEGRQAGRADVSRQPRVLLGHELRYARAESPKTCPGLQSL